MGQQRYDPGSKWLLEKQGAAILWLAGLTQVRSCKALQSEAVQLRKTPDGLLEVQMSDRRKLRILIEVATVPEKRVVTQMTEGVRLVRALHGKLPEAVVLVLREKGSYRVPESVEVQSELGWTSERLSWKVIEVWRLSAEELLRAPDVGVVPWVTLARYEGSPEVLLQRCADRIHKEGGTQTDQLLTVTQAFASMKYDRPNWLSILGGRKTVIESPLFRRLTEEVLHKAKVEMIQRALQTRFGEISPETLASLHQVVSTEALDRLFDLVVGGKDITAFEQALAQELPQPSPRSSRSRRKRGTESE